MVAADDGGPKRMAAMHEVKIAWNKNVYPRIAPINKISHHAYGGKGNICLAPSACPEAGPVSGSAWIRPGALHYEQERRRDPEGSQHHGSFSLSISRCGAVEVRPLSISRASASQCR